MIVIGVDTHKRSHALAAVNAATGFVAGELEIRASEAGHAEALRFFRPLDRERVWAIEDCRHVSAHFERALIGAGERVVRVAPARMGASRRSERRPGKSDQIDALAIARAVVRDGVEQFPAAVLDEQAMDIRLLQEHRDQLVTERTRLINRLRWHLVQLDPELEASVPPRSIELPSYQRKIVRRLARVPQTVRVRIARKDMRRIVELTREAEELQAELARLVRAYHPRLLAEPGCGPISAAILIGHSATATRFRTDGQFARHAGTAPIPASSGNTTRYRLHRGGDRQINRALHTIALYRARNDASTRAYIARKISEGKTKREAMRCLKRHLARQIWQILRDPLPPPAASQSKHRIVGQAPVLNPCICR
jgi:transposase